MSLYVLQCRHRTCDVGRREPGSRVDGLHRARDRLRALSPAHDFVGRRVRRRLGCPLEVSVAGL